MCSSDLAYRKTIELNPGDPRPYNNLAWLYADREQNLDEALGLARKAVALMPNRGEILDTLGWVYARKGMLKEAEQTLRQAVTLTPNRASVLYHLGFVQYRLGRLADAASEMRRALRADANFPEAAKAREILAETAKKPS